MKYNSPIINRESLAVTSRPHPASISMAVTTSIAIVAIAKKFLGLLTAIFHSSEEILGASSRAIASLTSSQPMQIPIVRRVVMPSDIPSIAWRRKIWLRDTIRQNGTTQSRATRFLSLQRGTLM